MTKESLYLDLSQLTADQRMQIVELCDAQNIIIYTQVRKLLAQGDYDEKMPFLFYSTEFRLFWQTYIRHTTKEEVDFETFVQVITDTFANEFSEANSVEEKADAVINFLNGFALTDNQKLEIITSTRKRLEMIKK